MAVLVAVAALPVAMVYRWSIVSSPDRTARSEGVVAEMFYPPG